MLQSIINGFASALSMGPLLAMVVGIAVGGWFGAMPGLTTTMAMAICVPLTFFMEPLIGIPFLLGLYKGGMWGGSVPAVLINVPGTGAAVATAIDGHMLSKQGFAKKALLAALIASATGEFLADVFVIFVMEPLSKVALLFGAADFFSLILCSLIVMATVSEGSFIKGFISLGIGLFLSTVGMDPAFGIRRFNFGILAMSSGFNFVSIVVGLFAFSEVLSAVLDRKNTSLEASTAKDWGPGLSMQDLKSIIPPILKGTVIGTIIGMVPAVGQPVAAFLGYGVEKKTNKHPEKFGKGALEGVAAPEAANNSVNGGALVPLLTFGIPGDVVTAILLGALTVQGLRPGPRLMIDNKEIMYTIFASLIIGNFLLLVVGRLLIEPFAKLVMIPRNILLPILIILCFIGTYAINNSMFDVYVSLAFGILGYNLKKHKFSVSTLAISFLLGGPLEKYMVQALSISKGDWSTFVIRPISLGFLVITLICVLFAIRTHFFKGSQKAA